MSSSLLLTSYGIRTLIAQVKYFPNSNNFKSIACFSWPAKDLIVVVSDGFQPICAGLGIEVSILAFNSHNCDKNPDQVSIKLSANENNCIIVDIFGGQSL